MTKNVELVMKQIGSLSTDEQKELFEALDDLSDGVISELRLHEFLASGEKGIPVRDAFAQIRKQTWATQ
jgi:hypothetical protein